jgi:hypothetical protein
MDVFCPRRVFYNPRVSVFCLHGSNSHSYKRHAVLISGKEGKLFNVIGSQLSEAYIMTIIKKAAVILTMAFKSPKNWPDKTP